VFLSLGEVIKGLNVHEHTLGDETGEKLRNSWRSMTFPSFSNNGKRKKKNQKHTNEKKTEHN